MFIFRGITAVSLSFMFIGAVMFKSGPFIRPHPLFWRLILAASVLYLLAVIFLLFQVRLCMFKSFILFGFRTLMMLGI